MRSKVWDEITYLFPNFNFTSPGMWLLIHAGIKVLTMLVKGTKSI